MFSNKRNVFAFVFCLLLLASFTPVPTPAALRVAGVPLVGPAIACAQPIQDVCDPKDNPGCEDEEQVPTGPGRPPPSDPRPCNWEALAEACATCAVPSGLNPLKRLWACARCTYYTLTCGT